MALLEGTAAVNEIITIVTDTRWNVTAFQKKTRTLTIVDGLITAVSAESDWTDIVTA